MKPYEKSIFDLQFHLKYQGAVFVPAKSFCYDYELFHGAAYLLYYISYRTKSVVILELSTDDVQTVLDGGEVPEVFENTDGFKKRTLSMDKISNSPDSVLNCIGHIKSLHKIPLTCIIDRCRRIASDTADIKRQKRYENLGKEVYNMPISKRRDFLVKLVNEDSFYYVIE